jgi:hypothetical protein
LPKKAYAFGSGVKERTASFIKKFRYGFNGKENNGDIVLDPCKVGQIYENKLGLNNFTTKWEQEEHSRPRIGWPYCRKASVRDKQQPAGSTT